MHQESQGEQPAAAKVEQVSAAVTAAEKEELRFVAGLKKKSLSELLREHSITDLLEEGDRVRAKLATLAEEGAHA